MKNIVGIFLVIFVLFLLLVLTAINGTEFKRGGPDEIKKVVLYESGPREGFVSQGPSPQSSTLCEKTGQDRNKACHSQKNKKTCTSHDCCIWVSRFKGGPSKALDHNCLAGNADGPETSSEKEITDEWYYKKKSYRQKSRNQDLLREPFDQAGSHENHKVEYRTQEQENKENKLKADIETHRRMLEMEAQVKKQIEETKHRCEKTKKNSPKAEKKCEKDIQELEIKQKIIKKNIPK
tara:strand:- start:246 stop:953 length:708 start_codon:yes stop_codon:yes gene_type:complete